MDSRFEAKRLLMLATTTGYQTRAFVEAAQKLGLSVVFGTDRCHVLRDPWQDGAIPLRFEDPEVSAGEIVEYARKHPVDAIVSLGDRPTPTAARACRALGLSFHPPEAADACRDKYLSRACLAEDPHLLVPDFRRVPIDFDPMCVAARVEFPCVLKPLALSASRGVIRADNREEFASAFERIRTMLRSPDVQVMREGTSRFIQVERYIDGAEIAVEAVVDRGRLRLLAILDKPDPLVGPFFEEEIYVTPSRLQPATQDAIADTLDRAVRKLGLEHGPVHAEFRVNEAGVWILEIAARSIGGLCARALRFTAASGEYLSLEELLIRLACGEDVSSFKREAQSSGVMMIPIPRAGVYQSVEGLDDALVTEGVEGIEITAKPAQKLVGLPEGSTYLGFIFARGPAPGFVEDALRRAHQKLHFAIDPALPVVSATTGG